MSDHPITAPAHYTVYPVQPIEITRYLGFCLGNAVKYVLRAPYKGGVDDLQKALQYLEWEEQTPSRPLDAKAHRAVEEKIGDVCLFLAEKQPRYSWFQAAFLEYVGFFVFSGDAEYIRGMRSAVEAMLEAMEGAS